MTDHPILCTWDGEHLIPASRHWARQADAALVVGERYLVHAEQGRSEASHRHEFAWLHEAWMNLPDNLAEIFPTSEHLRKRALVDAGWYSEDVIECGSKAAALRVASYVRGHEEFVHVIVSGPVVAVRRPRSQSRKAMSAKEFQQSKSDVMRVVAELLGVKESDLHGAASA